VPRVRTALLLGSYRHLSCPLQPLVGAENEPERKHYQGAVRYEPQPVWRGLHPARHEQPDRDGKGNAG
jgi:hypothetical protein